LRRADVIVPTYTATIYAGLRPGYFGRPRCFAAAVRIARIYADEVGLCVTVTRTTFVYTEGDEPGVIVGLINYPRFPSEPVDIRAHALALAERLQRGLSQHRVSVVLPNETVMVGGDGPGVPS
jgi:hypothetical protein